MRDAEDNRRLLVCDTDNHRLQLVSLDGEPIGKQGGSYGTLPGQYISPSAVARDERATFVADTGNNRLQKIGGNKLPGIPECHTRSCGMFHSLQGRKLRKALSAPNCIALYGDLVFVSDQNCRIMAFDTDDLLPKYEIGRAGVANGQFGGAIGGMAAYGGELYVSDTANDRVQVFDAENGGKYVRTHGSHGSEAG